MRKSFIGGNWKMHGTPVEISTLVSTLLKELKAFNRAEVAVFPSFVYLETLQQLLKGSSIKYGAQNLNEHELGAYTGEISPIMLKDFGCTYVLVGHSERRQLFAETNERIAQKFVSAIQHDLIPILCVGETQTEREKDQTEHIISVQLKTVIDLAGIEMFRKAIIAYEPVWAIGTGLTATPNQAQSVHVLIRQLIASYHEEIATNLRIIYGGSVKADNAKALFDMPDIDGGLVGGASLKAKEFADICRAAK